MKAGKWFCLVLAVLLLLGAMPVYAAESGTVVASGVCGADGDNVGWTRYADNTVVISGSGDMMDNDGGYGVSYPVWGYSVDPVKIRIEEGVTNIGPYAFGHITIESVSIPSTVTRIEKEAFVGSQIKGTLNIPDSVKYIGAGAFSGCTVDGQIVLPDDLTDIAIDAFSGEAWKADANGFVMVNNVLLSYVGEAESVTVPANVRKISSNAFFGTSVRSVTLPEGLTEIGTQAFFNCESLEEINIPSSVTSIGAEAFTNTPWYENQTGLICVGHILLKYSGEASSVTVPAGIKEIAGGAFASTGVQSVTLPKGLERIGDSAFAFTQISNIQLPQSLKSIGEEAFRDCPLTELSLPSGLTELGSGAFANTQIRAVTIPSGVKTVGGGTSGGGAFNYCEKLESVTFTGPVALEAFVFWNCGALKTVNGAEYVQRLGRWSFAGTGLTEVNFKNCRMIPYEAFAGCNDLRSVILPGGLTALDDYAFLGCPNLTEITVPARVTSIGEEALGFVYSESGGSVPLEGFTVTGKTGSVAETYAKEHGFAFVPLDVVLLGDVTGDGGITSADALQIQRYVVKRDSVLKNASKAVLDAADVTQDGQVTSADALQIQRHVVKRPSVLD